MINAELTLTHTKLTFINTKTTITNAKLTFINTEMEYRSIENRKSNTKEK